MKKLLVFILAILLLAGCSKALVEKVTIQQNNPQAQAQETKKGPKLKVHFLDVGQGDCILVQFPDGKNMLVDAGKNDSANTIVNYLKKIGVNNKIDFLVGTHPHEDHIGSMDTVIKTFQIGEVYMPRATTTTKTFRDVLQAIKDKGLKITTAKAGVNIMRADNLTADIIAPHKGEYESLNNHSAVIKITYDKVSFLLTGDAEKESEAEMLLSSAINTKANVLKVAHHGSNSSTSPAFLELTAPKYAVISVGANNDYHHPHKVTMDRLKKAGVQVLRTDEKGTIVFTTDGKVVSFTTMK